MKTLPDSQTRREFLKTTTLTAATLAGAGAMAFGPGSSKSRASEKPNPGPLPWYRRTLRWGQTNITEIDATRYDIDWWRQHWKRTRIQGVLINAGGIYASYPSKFPLHYRPPALGDRDLYGELARAAHDDGLAVIARMDSNRVHEPFFRAHPDWFARDANGEPYRVAEFYVTCVNSPYYDEYIPDVLREIIERSHPEGFGDNNWNGLERDKICYCDNCRRKFHDLTGQPIPKTANWEDPTYQKWIQWNYARRLEIWDLNNRTAQEAGGPHCLWIGMNSGSLPYQGLRFRDYKGICDRAKIFLLDDQQRNDSSGFQHNGQIGKLIHELLGWDKLIPEATALYQMGKPPFRVASKPEPEARLWMLEGFAAGVQPWWHHIGAYQEDRRMFHTATPILSWHAENEGFLINRRPVANVALLWTQQNTDFYGRDNADDIVDLPWRGWTNALVRARIPHLPIHADNVEREKDRFRVLILPNLAAMSAAQVESVRRFVEHGGSLVASGESSRCNEWGERLKDFALADVFGAHVVDGKPAYMEAATRAAENYQTYLHLNPATAWRTYGPNPPGQSHEMGPRHPALKGFDETNILPFGGMLDPLRVEPDAKVLATFIPAITVFPPEQAYIHQFTDIPGLIVRETSSGGRVAFLPADVDRRFGRDNLPDGANLLANLVHWAANGVFPLRVQGAGLVDCHLYEQNARLILHLVNLTNTGTWRGPVDELIRVGPLTVKVQLPQGLHLKRVESLVSKRRFAAKTNQGFIQFQVPEILDHEVVVIS